MNEGKSSIADLEEGTVAAAAYFPFLCVIILLMEKRSNFVRFHAIQSTLVFGMLAVYWLAVKWIGALHFLWWSPSMIALFFTAYMMFRAYHGEEVKLPLIGKFAFGAVYDTSETEDFLATVATPGDESANGTNGSEGV